MSKFVLAIGISAKKIIIWIILYHKYFTIDINGIFFNFRILISCYIFLTIFMNMYSIQL